VLRKRRIAAWLAIALAATLGLTACSEGPHIVYGYMDAWGHWVVRPEYPAALEFSEGLAAVEQDGRWGYIGTRGQWVIEPRFDTATPFAEGLAAVEVDGAWSFISPTGTTVVRGPFDEAHPFYAGLAAVEVGNKWGFVDHEGRMVVAPLFDRIADYTTFDFGWRQVACFNEGLCAANQSDKWGYIDHAGAWAIAPRYEDAEAFHEGLAAVRDQTATGPGKVGFIDRTGAWVITPRYENSLWFSGGRAVAVVARPATAGSRGDAVDPQGTLVAVMIDATGREIADVGWNELLDVFDAMPDVLRVIAPDYLADGLIPATRDDRWGFMDRTGRWVIEPRFDAVFPFRNGQAKAGLSDEPSSAPLEADRWGLIDSSGRWLIEPNLEWIGGYGGATSHASLHGRRGTLDIDGKWRVPPRHADEDDLFRVLGVDEQQGDGLQRVGVYANHAWVVADARGRKSRPREFAWLTPIGGLAAGSPQRLAYLQDGSWGIADGRMGVLVPPQFDDAPSGSGEVMLVRRQGIEDCLDTRGRSVALERCASGGPSTPRPDSSPDDGGAPADETRRFYMQNGEGFDGRWLTRTRLNEAWGVADDAGREILPARYAAVGLAFDGMIAVRPGEQWQIVDMRGRTVFPSRPEKLAPFTRDVAIFCDGGHCGLLHRSGQVLVPPRYGAISPVSRREATVHVLKPSGEYESTGIVDAQGRLRVPPDYYDIRPFSDALWLARDADGRCQLLDRSSGQPIAVSARLAGRPEAFHEGLAAVDLRTPDGHEAAGYVDARGRIAIEPRFDPGGAEAFIRGAALVTKDGKCGMIDRRGAVLMPLDYDHCERTPDGGVLAGVEAPWRATAETAVAAPPIR
jgi:hypothetical protein